MDGILTCLFAHNFASLFIILNSEHYTSKNGLLLISVASNPLHLKVQHHSRLQKAPGKPYWASYAFNLQNDAEKWHISGKIASYNKFLSDNFGNVFPKDNNADLNKVQQDLRSDINESAFRGIHNQVLHLKNELNYRFRSTEIWLKILSPQLFHHFLFVLDDRAQCGLSLDDYINHLSFLWLEQ